MTWYNVGENQASVAGSEKNADIEAKNVSNYEDFRNQ